MMKSFKPIVFSIGLALLGACSKANNPSGANTYDVTAPEITEHMASPSILVFSKTKEWRHNEGIAGANSFFVELARDNNYGIFTTENGAVFNSKDLSRFELVVFNNMTGDTLSTDQEAAFKTWLMDGGAWIGIHGSGDSSHKDWDWYQNQLIGPTFTGHPAAPQFQKARVVNLAPDHPVMAGIGADFIHKDEWYSFDSVAQDYGHTPLAGLDETTYKPRNHIYGDVSDLRMGNEAIEHPIIWSNCPGTGRMVYSAIGHSDKSYKDPVVRKILENSFKWVTVKTDTDGAHCPAKE